MLLYKDDYRYVRSNELKVKKEVKSIFFSTEKELNKNRKFDNCSIFTYRYQK